ncbi:unnamed protein product [Rangifer tarandus platyrhynchus]|uniref:Uncharacterized protein n=1 Tax=Rangifer tarandus platyrhynchus TaxID=3082113 RepID=A0ABN8ZHX2_RANTA|nr:unnamed protein product [Rangifer tarandus platyrhynchus]
MPVSRPTQRKHSPRRTGTSGPTPGADGSGVAAAFRGHRHGRGAKEPRSREPNEKRPHPKGPASLGAGPAPRAGEMPASRRAAVQSGGAPVRTDGSRPNPRALGRVVPPPRRAERRARAGLGAAAAADAA